MTLALTIDEAIKESRLGRSTLFEAIRRGELIARKHGRRTIVLRTDLEAFLQSLPTRATRRAA